jgi:class 3 adenylate cyclase
MTPERRSERLMIYCTNCGQPDADPIGLCQRCATSMARRCAACDQLGLAANRFCGHCGIQQEDQTLAALQPLPPSVRGQSPATPSARREVTVLFLDVTNFTAASHALDSEDVFEWISETMRLLADVVRKYEGTIDKFTGDGLMALFGAPDAHENDPELAVRAALEMQQIVQPLRERIRQKHGFDFQMRLGINTGTVIAGSVGGHAHAEYTVLGDTLD